MNINTNYIIKLIAVYAVIHIVAMDLGLPQSDFQINLLTNKYVIPIVLYAVAFDTTNDHQLSVIVTVLYIIGKFIIPAYLNKNLAQ